MFKSIKNKCTTWKQRVFNIFLSVLTLIILFFIASPLLNISMIEFVRYEFRETPHVAIKPVEIKIPAIEHKKGEYTITYDKISFVSPFGKELEIINLNETVSYTFSNSKALILTKTLTYEYDFYKEEYDNNKAFNKKFSSVLDSPFNFDRYLVSLTPCYIKLTDSLVAALQKRIFLVEKSMIPTFSKVYEFYTSEIKGLIFISEVAIRFDVYDLKDSCKYSFLLKNFTENEVSMLIGSISID